MALVPFTIYEGATKKTIDVDSIVTNATDSFIVDTSEIQVNNPPLDSIVLNIVFSGILPDPLDPPAAKVQVTIESKGEGSPEWFLPIGVLFDPAASGNLLARHVIVVQPNIFNIDEGVPLDIHDGQGLVTRLNRQQGILAADFRVVTSVFDSNGPGGGGGVALASLDIELFGDLYDHAG